MTNETRSARSRRHRLGVYVHIPFCAHRCDYCAFATWTDRTALADAYLDACAAQAVADLNGGDLAGGDLAGGARPTSVFIGGGTPSLVDGRRLGALIAGFDAAGDAEITVECNPDDVTSELVASYVDAGVNRISMGVQSMDPVVLGALGRTHDPVNVRRAVDVVHDAGLAFNVDLIYGAAGESVASWEATLDAALALEPVHVSAYALTVEAGTPLAKDRARYPDDDDQAIKYVMASERLAAAGFEWYEISNWAKPGHRCEHNLTYWLGGDYVAVGCAAHGYRAGRRYWHVHTPERFIAAVTDGRSPVAGSEELDEGAARIERLELLLRTGAGVPIDAFDSDDVRGVGPGLASGALVGLLERVERVDPHWEVDDGPRWVLTERGRMLESEVAFRLR